MRKLLFAAILAAAMLASFLIGQSSAPMPKPAPVIDNYCEGYAAAINHANHVMSIHTDGSLWLNPDYCVPPQGE